MTVEVHCKGVRLMFLPRFETEAAARTAVAGLKAATLARLRLLGLSFVPDAPTKSEMR